jgi:AbrB family looped-hinge helix DNA binding protein
MVMQRSVAITAKGQITIPKDVREALGLKSGDHLVLSLVENEVVMTAKTVDLSALAGFLGDPPKGRASLEEINEAVLDAAGAHISDERGRSRKDDAA